jgi:MFS family permease
MTSAGETPAWEVNAADVDSNTLRWEEKVEQLEFEALDRVRTTAEKWAVSLGGILGLFSTLLLVKGPSDIGGLTRDFKVIVGVVLVLALLAAVLAVYLAGLAAQGIPETVAWPSGAELREWERNQAKRAKARLRRSRQLTVPAVGLVIGAIALTWYGPRPPARTPTAVTVPVRDVAMCGNLLPRRKAIAIRSTRAKGSPANGASAGDLVVVAKCP